MAKKAPANLALKGRNLWRQVTNSFDLGPHELLVLEDACREADLIDRLDTELRDSPLIVSGSMGQQVANPLVQELRQHRATLARLLGFLKLPDEASGAGGQAGQRSATARAAAQARWGRGA